MAKRYNLCRFGVVWNGEEYDVFSIFRSEDDSIFLHTYSKTTKNVIKSTPITRINGQIGVPVNISELEKEPFSKQKISFHPSGIIHSTDHRGDRLSKDEGILGIPFGRVDTWAMLFTFYPMSPEKYRKRRNGPRPSLILDIESEGLVPYAITCYLVKHSFNFGEIIEKHTILPGRFIKFDNYLPSHQLDLVISYHSSSFREFLPRGELTGYFTHFRTE